MANILANPLWEERTAAAARMAGIPDQFLSSFYRQMALESGNFDPSIISGQQASPAGARGLAQFMPDTLKDFPHDPTNWQSSLNAGAQYMARLFQRTGNWGQAQAAYNMGPGNLQKFLHGDISLPPETAAYLDTTGSAAQFSGSAPELPVVDVQSTFPSLSSMVGNAMQHMSTNMADMLGQAQADRIAAETQRDQYQKQLDTMGQQPAPQNDPNAEFVTRLMGGISQALSPRMGGQQLAENTLEGRLQGIRDQRRQSMEVLANKLQMAAGIAAKAGEHEKSVSLMAKYNNVLKDLELHMQTYGLETDRTTAQAHQTSAQADLVRALTSGNNQPIDKTILTEGLQPLQATKAALEAALLRNGKDKFKGKEMMSIRRKLANTNLLINTAMDSFQQKGVMPDLTAADVLDQHVQESVAGAQKAGYSLQQALSLVDKMPGNDEQWKLGQEGITKHEFKMALMNAWPKPQPAAGPASGGVPADPSGPAPLSDAAVAMRFLTAARSGAIKEAGGPPLQIADKIRAMVEAHVPPAMIVKFIKQLTNRVPMETVPASTFHQ